MDSTAMFMVLYVFALSGDFALSLVNPPPPGTVPSVNPTGPSPPARWCIANPTASQTALQVALDYACGYGGTDCSAIQPSGPCFDPSTVRDHASYAFNSYYQKNPVPTSCAFGGAAQLVSADPSYGNCRFASPSTTPRIPTSTTPAIPTTPTTPTTTVPTTQTTPTAIVPVTPTVQMRPPSSIATPAYPSIPGGNGYGSEPAANDYGSITTGNPNQAGRRSVNLVLFIIMNSLILSVTAANHF